MSTNTRSFSIRTAVVLVVLALFALSSLNLAIAPKATAASNLPTILRMGEVSAPPIGSFNPLNPSCNTHLCSLLYDYPFSLNFPPLPEIAPRMASGYSVNPTQTSWVINLLPNLKWSDGSPLTSSDLAFSLKIYNDSGYFTTPNVTSITIMNSTAVQIGTQPGDFIFFDILYSGLEILPQETFGAYNASTIASFPDLTNIVSDGAFYLTNYTLGENPVVLQANPYYWQGVPHYQTMYFYQYSSSASLLNAIQAAQIDATYCGPGQCVASPGYRIVGPPQAIPGHTVGVELNDWQYPFNITTVRQALAYATNVSEINFGVNGAFAPNASENQDLLLPAYNQAIGFSNGTGPVGYSYNIATAKQLFMQAGFKYSGNTLEYPNGTAVVFNIQWATEKPWWGSTATILASDWQKIGIKCDVVAEPLTTINNLAQQQNPVGWQVLTIGVSPGFMNNWGVTPGPGVIQELGTYEVPVNGVYTFWNQTYASVYHQLLLDAVNSSQYMADAQKLAYMNAHDVPVIPLYNVFGYLIVSNSIYWGSDTQDTGIYNTQAETSPVFWDETLFEATPLSSSTTITSTLTTGGSTTVITSVVTSGSISTTSVVTTSVATSVTTSTTTSVSTVSSNTATLEIIAAIIIAVAVIGGIVAFMMRRKT